MFDPAWAVVDDNTPLSRANKTSNFSQSGVPWPGAVVGDPDFKCTWNCAGDDSLQGCGGDRAWDLWRVAKPCVIFGDCEFSEYAVVENDTNEGVGSDKNGAVLNETVRNGEIVEKGASGLRGPERLEFEAGGKRVGGMKIILVVSVFCLSVFLCFGCAIFCAGYRLSVSLKSLKREIASASI